MEKYGRQLEIFVLLSKVTKYDKIKLKDYTEGDSVTEKELKKLSRVQLLEMLLIQTREVENLQKKLSKAESMLSERYMNYLEAGSLAEAMLKVNGVIDAAQAAADQYLENIASMEQNVKEYCRKQLAQAAEDAARIRSASSEQEAHLLYETMISRYE